MAYVTQFDKVLMHLQSGKKITAKKAMKNYKIGNLYSIIYQIKQAGYDIRTDVSDTITTYYLANERQNKWLEKVRNMKLTA